MASKGVELSLLLVLALMLCHGATAQSGCTNVVMGLAPCLNYVTGNSSTPSSSCCSKLANVVQSQPLCLCALLNDGGSSVGVNINQTLALSLPGACNVQTPPVSRCNGTSTIKICVFFLGNRGLGGWKINLYSIKLCNFFYLQSAANGPASSPTSPPADSSDDTPSIPSIPGGKDPQAKSWILRLDIPYGISGRKY